MWEILADVAVLVGDGPFRAVRARRARRRLQTGLPARIPCSARSERPGWPARYTDGSVLLTPGRPTAAFGSRAYPCLRFAVGGERHDPEPKAWYDQDRSAVVYHPSAGETPVYLQVHSQYLPALRLGLAGVR
ncbi:hypothetical protein GCM10010441_75210 [Kitasatospora paracochleata]|uniref:Uncharacterized protein n=1 Tax=Kitasatospora paracochleata TaxID=58354 RepID=A0ABT1IXT4_9ACTN|nr:hypothetical protein [Kitasatospora paracochleata]MCP2309954.1 hypothetical protein [Kitasatospora paracochleata]